MNLAQIQAAIKNGAPFVIQMADGKEYSVPHSDYISVPPKGAYVVVYNDLGQLFVLPLLTMTGLAYQAPQAQ